VSCKKVARGTLHKFEICAALQVETLVPPQNCAPTQALPQVPQFPKSCVRSAQRPEQQLQPVGHWFEFVHAGKQVPVEHRWPPLHSASVRQRSQSWLPSQCWLAQPAPLDLQPATQVLTALQYFP
jgi:hypothetical protein